MRLPDAPEKYDHRDAQELRREIESELNNRVHRKGAHVVLSKGEAIRMYDTVTGGQVELTVASGVLVVTAL